MVRRSQGMSSCKHSRCKTALLSGKLPQHPTDHSHRTSAFRSFLQGHTVLRLACTLHNSQPNKRELSHCKLSGLAIAQMNRPAV
jgi:hypothetical protein